VLETRRRMVTLALRIREGRGGWGGGGTPAFFDTPPAIFITQCKNARGLARLLLSDTFGRR
jgi:hypothetical protein